MKIEIEIEVPDDSPLARTEHVAVVAANADLYASHPNAALVRLSGTWGNLVPETNEIREVPQGRSFRRIVA